LRALYREAMKVAFEPSFAQADKLRREAGRLGIAPADLARAAIADLLATRDEEFRAALQRASRKNGELYRRLA
jgi:hypothetical protein